MTEIWMDSYDQLKLFMRFWPAQNPKASVLIVHGLGDHSGRYELLARFLASQGINVYALDLRGHGRSGGKRGHITLSVDYLMDISTALSKILPQEKTPLFLLGHSMGALFSLSFICGENTYGLKGVIVSSPFFAPFEKIPFLTQIMMQLVNIVFPSFSIQRNSMHTTLLSHDVNISKRYLSDPLSHLKISARLFCAV
jgi:alpha-beta hydrolase superfamily lysophospholipase